MRQARLADRRTRASMADLAALWTQVNWYGRSPAWWHRCPIRGGFYALGVLCCQQLDRGINRPINQPLQTYP
jgi:hypothetical protein